MTEQTHDPAAEQGQAAPAATKRARAGGLNGMLLADLKQLAGGLGIKGAGSMKKAQLVEAIKAAQSGGQSGGQSSAGAAEGRDEAGTGRAQAADAGADAGAPAKAGTEVGRVKQRTRGERARGEQPQQRAREEQPQQAERPARDRAEERQDRQQGERQDRQQDQQAERQDRREQGERQDRQQDPQGRQQGKKNQNQNQKTQQGQGGDQGKGSQGGNQQGNQHGNQQGQGGGKQQGNQQGGQQGGQNQQNPGNQNLGEDVDDDDDEGGRRSRRRRGRERDRTRRGEVDTTILEDDVLVPAAGILDVLDNYAFVRTSGYLAGTDDVYVSLTMVRKYGLRRGDAVTGQVRQPREGERKEKFNPMVKIESVNGQEPDASRNRPDFARLTPLYPSERLRLETGPADLVGRVVDLLAPVGKGQRGMVVAPPGSGRTTLLQSIADSVTANNPECHLMVVLVDERPEEVTDVERRTKGEVIASTFDRQPADHTAVAELAVERAKRLVELGHDVVVLLDGLTRLTRAYNLAAPSSGRTLEGGLDPQSLHPAKRLFGAARNIENGGSLTILATAVADSGSATDQRILEEFRGTGNHELRLRSDLAARRLFPAVDVAASGTRRADLLLAAEEVAVVEELRSGLAGLEPVQAMELLLDRLGATQTNYELLRSVQAQAGETGGKVGR